MTMPAAVRLPWTFAVEPIAREVAAIADDEWELHFNTGIYAGDWSTAALRAPVGGVGAFAGYPDPTATGFAPTDLLDRCPATAAVLAAVPAELLSARFLRLGPGAEIREHRDHMLGHAHGEVRLHVGVTSNAGAELVVDGGVVPVAPGECWYVDASRPHRARNDGAADRVHLVIDCVVGAELDSALRSTM
ncbi:aspartyl/asparaginyl beta-hydroxylase domain-containing protein [Iamia sp. SCSIO 61187]|uniref:aspartyl/asparaginyl beta-hydroxylase domain-containing protein n=1 Tax=Iamia sp. SCSIO 61187 TaxID=2722752 RepID=UPI001C62B4B6|nr:aspartyl/asparaginyl beta-hydroxylase domain-containing protein [Iamia sp. SCSIO 61187]QYG91871.1 aspartyl/asparaginyl beta-hydroxylase domain-containing protein [Iamia sp. SCSIO 61187]